MDSSMAGGIKGGGGGGGGERISVVLICYSFLYIWHSMEIALVIAGGR